MVFIVNAYKYISNILHIARICENNKVMKTFIIKVIALVAMALFAVISVNMIKKLKAENERLIRNQEILLSEKNFIIAESQKYKVSDSLNAVKVSELEFTLKEYKRYRSKDLELIEQLKASKSDLQKVITSQYETIDALSAKLADSIKTDSSTGSIDTLKCFSYKSKWTDVDGCIDLKKDIIDMHIHNRESLKIVETVVYKRFLGFLWKTSKVKDKQVHIVSENPNTEITNCEYISIKQ